MADEMLTAGKVAEKLGVKPADIKKAIEAKNIEPDNVKGACKYYGPKSVAKIEKALKK